ncbi:MAG: alanine--tRNA ligase [Candidatus Nealsonbacteria bacterium CG10_big_fil_rev_8_21_14_0_10_36_24]|uniref:Alanine--tRNA ligase n=2 Tax=Candidatus Nealsoniibacteriota TaxID=1817911 RepID=A0A2H0YP14_9BACT|nr:MAG: alanine--tRNA ligase [Candidatus Nealsonbacteria bacterium CG10_big_fil_rev_8_21_14_0_10_36_24]PIS40218.1 MAG: alanine--tRNA ligase [Candidatus Nealsonbacteria bacterium CG08_land_8_20_14_0_20_36_22]
MTSKELRKKFLDFFKKKGHAIIPGASLIPEHDPTVLFTTAGMHPLTPFLLGEKHPAGQRLADAQKCVRTGDIDSIGDNWHLTFFEMLGNWSLGDYWKKEAIEWSFEFLTEKKWLDIPAGKLSITVFAGDKDAPEDKDSAKIWQKLGILKERIYYLPKEENWWGPAGQTGPCGPCTEMFYDTGKEKCNSNCRPGCSCGKYAEIWNDVFMEFNKTKEGKYLPLKQKNVDTGMGLERTIAVLAGFDNVYETELFKPIIKKIGELTTKNYPLPTTHYRIIADHLKAATFILAENIEPSNVERGYVLRRLIRRAVRHGRQIGIKNIFTHKVAESIIEIYPELKKNQDFIFEQLIREEEKFGKTLKRGLKQFERLAKNNKITGEKAFNLYQNYGFPLELTQELGKERNIKIDEKDFQEALKKHQELSRLGSEKKFKGGLADHSKKVTKYHTATHLLLAALRQILSSHIYQRGSNITAERLRFDFSHTAKLTPEELKKVEDLVNQKIKDGLEVKWEEMSLEEAKKQRAMGVFGEKYGERVKVYTIFNPKTGEIFSQEICGGPHVKRTSELGKFKIIKEESSGASVRRLRAVLE